MPECAIRFAFTVQFDESVGKWVARAVADPSIEGTDEKPIAALAAALRKAEKHMATLPYVDPATADTQHISRISLRAQADRKMPTLGWQARIDRYSKGKRVLIATRFFGDRAWGGSGFALAQAIDFRDQNAHLKKLPLAQAKKRARLLHNNNKKR